MEKSIPVFIFVVVLSFGCGGAGGGTDAGSSGGPDAGGETPDSGGGNGEDAGSADYGCTPQSGVSPTALSGAFVTRSLIAVKITQGGLSPNPQVTQASQYFVVTYEQNGTHLKSVTKLCHIDLPDTQAIGDMRVTETFWQKRPVSEFLPSIADEGDLLSTAEPCAAYTPSQQTVFLGYDGSENPDLPADPASDPRVFDQDGDGKPGVTIHIEGLPIIGSIDGYVVEKTITRESGIYMDPNRIEGTIDFYSAEENVFDASNPAAKGNNPAISYVNDPPRKNAFGELLLDNLDTFVSKRVDGANGSPALLTGVLQSEGDLDAACKQLFGLECDPVNTNRCWATCWDSNAGTKIKCTEADLFD